MAALLLLMQWEQAFEVVLYASGSSARQTEVTNNRPVDATIMAIVDTYEVDGEVLYNKGHSD